jgi:hypothetical protein
MTKVQVDYEYYTNLVNFNEREESLKQKGYKNVTHDDYNLNEIEKLSCIKLDIDGACDYYNYITCQLSNKRLLLPCYNCWRCIENLDFTAIKVIVNKELNKVVCLICY